MYQILFQSQLFSMKSIALWHKNSTQLPPAVHYTIGCIVMGVYRFRISLASASRKRECECAAAFLQPYNKRSESEGTQQKLH